MIWDSERRSKHQRMADAAELVNGKEIPRKASSFSGACDPLRR